MSYPKYILVSADQKGGMTDEQQAFYNTINETISNNKNVSFMVIDANDVISKNIMIGDNSYAIAGNMNRHITAQGIIDHITKEGFELQTLSSSTVLPRILMEYRLKTQ